MPSKNRPSKSRRRLAANRDEADGTGRAVRPGQLRIIGGKLRGSTIQYSGDTRTRPMKDRVREAVFNLVGPAIKGTHAIDLFAGTGALAIESISRGSLRATAIERHFPTARLIQDNVRQLQLESQVTVLTGDAFFWAKKLPDLGTDPWVVYCSPPFVLYTDAREEMIEMINRFVHTAPPGSRILVEADESFDFSTLDLPEAWDVRAYSPAFVGLMRIAES